MVRIVARLLSTRGYVPSGSKCANILKGYVTVPQWPKPSAVTSHRARTLRVYGIRKVTETTDSAGRALIPEPKKGAGEEPQA